MNRPIACAFGGMLLAGAAVAGEPLDESDQRFYETKTAASYIICVGENACDMLTDEHCAVALGANTEFPPHASHVLVTPKGIWSLQRLDDRIVRMINRQIALTGNPPLRQSFIDKWNDVCSGFSGVPMS